ncbi:hypothetical protein FO488_13300 [Geobacter sp. FeAm09]|uniref:hypothetical protein n=1 Tax=Geobacter sp. FeAm09 TaxID=2597769 RepID=UPI0011ED7AA1|nr:hypothetical protein [Geobacter sp. FeAm09]QEM69037.1 hypothetical protein FO488_13300 [Geobacter sp. FeAm09]
MQESLIVVLVVCAAFLSSVPCGYLRQNYKKYSFMWFLLIHVSIPIIALLRISAGLSWRVIPLTVGGAVAGQITGGIINRRRKQNG